RAGEGRLPRLLSHGSAQNHAPGSRDPSGARRTARRTAPRTASVAEKCLELARVLPEDKTMGEKGAAKAREAEESAVSERPNERAEKNGKGTPSATPLAPPVAPPPMLAPDEDKAPSIPPLPAAGPWRSYKELVAQIAQKIVDAQRPIRVLQSV